MNDGVLQFKKLGKFSSFYALSPKLYINLVTEPLGALPFLLNLCHCCSWLFTSCSCGLALQTGKIRHALFP